MSEFIIIGIVLILGVNGLYSRFCEKVKEYLMSDLIFVGTVVAFFMVGALYTLLCEKL